jgi:MFS family permease
MSTTPLRRNRDFVLLQVGQTLSTIGSESTAIAYPLLVLGLTHSPAKAGIVGFARTLPWPLLGFVAGVIADRSQRKRVMIATDLVRVCGVTSIVVALLLHSLSFTQIVLVAFLEGSMFVLFNIAEFGALRSVVPIHQLPVAVAAEQARYSTVGLVAPPLGGALYGVTRSLPWLGNAVSTVFSLGSLLAIRTPFQADRGEAAPRNLRAELAEGFRWLWRHRFLRSCALLFTFSNIVYEAIFLVLIVVARRHGLSSGEIGALIAVFGVCSLVGSALAPQLQRLISLKAMVIASFWLQLVIAVFVVSPNVYVLLGSTLPAALFLPVSSAAVIAYRVALVPERLTSRVNGVARTIALSGLPLGPLSAGLLLDSVSARTTVAVYSALLLILALVATSNRAIRNAPRLDDVPLPEPI